MLTPRVAIVGHCTVLVRFHPCSKTRGRRYSPSLHLHILRPSLPASLLRQQRVLGDAILCPNFLGTERMPCPNFLGPDQKKKGWSVTNEHEPFSTPTYVHFPDVHCWKGSQRSLTSSGFCNAEEARFRLVGVLEGCRSSKF